MKKIVTVIALALVCSGAYAQFNKGRMLVGGSIGFTSVTEKVEFNNTTTTNGKITDVTVTPTFGYFVIDHLAVGAGLDMTSHSEKEDGSSDKNTQTEFTFDPFARYYLDPGLFFQGRIGFGGANFKNVDGNTSTTTKYGLFKWDIGVGFAYFLTDNVAIEPLVYYGMKTYKDKDDDSKFKHSGIGVNIGLQVYLGPRD